MNQTSKEKWLIPGLGQEKYKLSLDHPAVPESKEVLKEQWGPMKRTQKPAWSSSHWRNLRQFEHQNT